MNVKLEAAILTTGILVLIGLISLLTILTKGGIILAAIFLLIIWALYRFILDDLETKREREEARKAQEAYNAALDKEKKQ